MRPYWLGCLVGTSSVTLIALLQGDVPLFVAGLLMACAYAVVWGASK